MASIWRLLTARVLTWCCSYPLKPVFGMTTSLKITVQNDRGEKYLRLIKKQFNRTVLAIGQTFNASLQSTWTSYAPPSVFSPIWKTITDDFNTYTVVISIFIVPHIKGLSLASTPLYSVTYSSYRSNSNLVKLPSPSISYSSSIILLWRGHS